MISSTLHHPLLGGGGGGGGWEFQVVVAAVVPLEDYNLSASALKKIADLYLATQECTITVTLLQN